MMSLSFGAPWLGAAALLGVPLLLAIHFLQLPARPERVSTLFLLDPLAPEGVGGRRLERLRSSVPLWLQMLAILVIAWILAQPRWLRADAAQTLVIVLDSSRSMEAFRDRLEQELPARLAALERTGRTTHWLVLESDPVAPRFYSGTDREALLQKLRGWRPRLGKHDFGPALRQAQALAQGRGTILFITDHTPAALPANVVPVQIGEPLPNVGFAGLTARPEGWEALIRNYGREEATRHWRLDEGPQESVTIPAGGMVTLRGPWPSGGQGVLRLTPQDRFPVDDTLPMVEPKPKRLRVALRGVSARHQGWMEAFLKTLTAIEQVETDPHLTLFFYDPLLPALPSGPAIVFLEEPQVEVRRLGVGQMVAERDPLLDGLSWDGLLASEGLALPPKPGDRPLLWQGDRRLIFLREGRQLVIGIDPLHSNATRLPAFIILLHRYVEQLRTSLPLPEAANLELHQVLQVAPAQTPPRWMLTREGAATPLSLSGPTLRAPIDPGFFQLRDHDTLLLSGATHFADPREADLSEASSQFDGLVALEKQQRERLSQSDPLTSLWLLLLGGIFILNWSWKAQ